jgi:hypothetical protein
VRFIANTETSVKSVMKRSTASELRMANIPIIMGSAAASTPPNTHTSATKLTGIAIDSINTTSRLLCSSTSE